MMNLTQVKDCFKPNKNISSKVMTAMVVVQVILGLIYWSYGESSIFPKPAGILNAIDKLFSQEDFISDLIASISLGFEAMWKTIIISLIISYATVIPFFRPFGFFISKLRFLTLVGLSFVFVILTDGSHSLKVDLLMFGISVFFITSTINIIKSISKDEYNYARTLGMSEWEVVWHVIILGKIDQIFEVIRQCFAICWVMLTMVEGLSRSSGGIGCALLNQNKHFNLDAVFAIQFMVLIIGVIQDYIIGFAKNIFCPYSNLTLERK